MQRCVAHCYRTAFARVPGTEVREVSLVLRTIHAQESRTAAKASAEEVVTNLKAMRFSKAASCLAETVTETRVYYAFPGVQLALNLASAKLRHIAGTMWSTKRYMSMELGHQQKMSA